MIDPRAFAEHAENPSETANRGFYQPFLFAFVVGALSVIVFMLVRTF